MEYPTNQTEKNGEDNIQFGRYTEPNNENGSADEKDMSKYTMIDGDNLDEDEPIKGQEYALFSFMSPEGIMNCDVRAFKFRGAYPTLEKAQERAAEIGKKDKYFKIFVGESGKWLDFDPPLNKVEREVTSNKEHQKILDVHAQRMKKINELAGRHKDIIDKKENGKKERIEETKKAGAASDAIYRQRAKKEIKKTENTQTVNKREKALSNIKERMRKKVAEKYEQKKQEKLFDNENKNEDDIPTDKKIEIISKATNELDEKKAQLATATENIDKIKKLMKNRNNSKY